MSTRYYSLERAARELEVRIPAVLAMCRSGCLPPNTHRAIKGHGEMVLVNAEAVDALTAAMRKREGRAA